MKLKPMPPELIRQETDMSYEEIFADGTDYQTSKQVPLALLKAGLITNVDVVPPNACCTALLSAAYADDYELAKLLIGKGANVNFEDRKRKITPLFQFVLHRDAKAVELLLSKGARVNVVDDHGTPLLHYAIQYEESEQIPLTRRLLAAGADPTLPDRAGQNLLIAAAGRQNGVVMQLLLSTYHMDANAKDVQGKTALTWAANISGRNRKENVALLLAAGANPWVTWGSQDVLEVLETFQARMPETFTDVEEISRMLREARTRFPKPPGFEEWKPVTNASR